mmetsp:Transcript_30413/g.47638  ORF Transcript_30413/g.47638 Transcript_30413/m.47638 type:complete len:87 (+) Transcript_30413:550-810(+)
MAHVSTVERIVLCGHRTRLHGSCRLCCGGSSNSEVETQLIVMSLESLQFRCALMGVAHLCQYVKSILLCRHRNKELKLHSHGSTQE